MTDPAYELDRTLLIELERYPRGPRGSTQNLFRSLYQRRRTSYFHRSGYTASDCERDVLALIREREPLFVLDRVDE